MSQSPDITPGAGRSADFALIKERGYYPGIAHPVFPVSLSLLPAPDLKIDALDGFLRDCLEVDPTPCRRLAAPLENSEGERVIAIAWRVLLLAAALQRAVRMPVFDAGCIFGARGPDGEGAWSVRCAVPALEGMPMATCEQACRLAARVVATFCRESDTPETRERLRDQLHQQFAGLDHRNIPGGRSTVPVLGEAFRRGIPYRHLGGGIYQLGWGCHGVLVDRSAQETDSAIGSQMSQNKQMTTALLTRAGLPASRHLAVTSVGDAMSAAEELGWPVVVKPTNRDRGEGIAVNVNDRETLERAFHAAAGLSPVVLVERQVIGVCHRLYVYRGRLLFAVKRLPKAVRGDGRNTVAELVAQANAQEQAKPPWSRLKPFPADTLARECLAGAGLSLEAVPDDGELAPLRPIQSDAWGGVVEEMTATIHPANVAIANRAARLFRLDSAGVDLITGDISRPWYENGAILNEINYAPLLTDGPISGDYLAPYVAGMVSDNGRIPVEAFVGGDRAVEAACARQRELLGQGVAAFATCHRETLDPEGRHLSIPRAGLFERCVALLMNPQVEAVILGVQTDEWLQRGLPVDRLSSVTFVDTALRDWRDPESALTESRVAALRELLDRDILESPVGESSHQHADQGDMEHAEER